MRRSHLDQRVHDSSDDEATRRAFQHLARAYEAAAEDHARRAAVLGQRGDFDGAEQEWRRCRVKHRLARAAVDGRFEPTTPA